MYRVHKIHKKHKDIRFRPVSYNFRQRGWLNQLQTCMWLATETRWA